MEERNKITDCNGIINTHEANRICRKYIHLMENFYIDNENNEYDNVKDIYEDATIEMFEESEFERRGVPDIDERGTATTNQIQRIYYRLRNYKEELSFVDADEIIKILDAYYEEG